uniref:Uncharacterized protein n=1 Tax=Syphacia muris TaxID=451379 RepID=A0A0N5AB23_9BILA
MIVGAKDGVLSCADELAPVFCKPKLIPLKSITIEKLEKMQREAMEKSNEKDDNDMKTDDSAESLRESETNNDANKTKSAPEIWSSEG